MKIIFDEKNEAIEGEYTLVDFRIDGSAWIRIRNPDEYAKAKSALEGEVLKHLNTLALGELSVEAEWAEI